MTPDEIETGSLTVHGFCATWSDRPDSGWACELYELPPEDQIAIVLAWWEDYCRIHAERARRESLKLDGKIAFLDEARWRK